METKKRIRHVTYPLIGYGIFTIVVSLYFNEIGIMLTGVVSLVGGILVHTILKIAEPILEEY